MFLSFLYRLIFAFSVIFFLAACVSSEVSVTDHTVNSHEFILKADPSGGLNRWLDFGENNESVSAVSLSTDGRFLAFGGDDPYVALWDQNTMTRLQRLKTSNRWINAIAFSNNSEIIAVAGDSNDIELFDRASGTLIFRLRGHRGGVKSISFYKDDRMLVSGSLDRTVKVWNLESGLPIKTLRGHTDSVNAVSVTDDTALIASGSSDGSVRIWSTEDGTVLKTLRDHEWHVLSVDFAEDNQTLASGGGDNTVRLYNARTGELLETFSKHRSAVNSVIFAGDLLVTGSEDGSCHLWTYRSAEHLRQEVIPKNERITMIAFAHENMAIAGSDGARLATSFKTQIHAKPYELIRIRVRQQIEEALIVEKIALIPEPPLPKLSPIKQGSFETKAMFLERIEIFKKSRSFEIKELVSEFALAVQKRNKDVLKQKKEYTELVSDIQHRKRLYIAREFQAVMNAPVLLPLYKNGKPAYDAERALLSARLKMNGADDGTELQFYVAAGEEARTLFNATKNGEVKSRAIYRFLDENTVELDRVEVVFDSKKYFGEAIEKRVLTVADPIDMILEAHQGKDPERYFLLQDFTLHDREVEGFIDAL